MGKAAEIMGSILTLIGLIIFGVSIGTVGWYTYETPAVFYEEGLFETCYTPTGESEVCRSLGWERVTVRVYFTRIFMIVAAVFYGFAVLFHLISLCCHDSTKGGLLITGATFYIIGALLNIAAPGVMIGFVELESTITVTATTFGGFVRATAPIYYGYSFYLAWVSGALIFIAAIVDCCAGCDAKQAQHQVIPQQVVWTTGIPQQTIVMTQPTTMVPQPTTMVPQPMPPVPTDQLLTSTAEYQW